MAEYKQILLGAKGCSGRGVRVRMLSLDECGKLREGVAQEVGPEATMMQFNIRSSVCSVAAMVAEVTETEGFKKAKDLVGATWKKVTREELEGEAQKYFSTADMDALVKLFQKTHTVTEKEVEDMLGEALAVTVD